MSEENTAAEAPQQQFSIQRTYLKDLSLETPMGAAAFMVDTQPNINQDLSTEINKMDEDVYETVVKLTITATVEDNTLFLVEVQQAGIFIVKGFDDKNLSHVLNTVCPQVLFPYAREAIDSSLTKATFPPLMMPPINFEALYAQALAEQQAQSH